MLQKISNGRVLELRFNRPPANAFNHALLSAVIEAIDAAPGEGAEGLVISGSPGLFSGGLDVPTLLTLDRDGVLATWGAFMQVCAKLAACPIPVVAALTGHSPAGGIMVVALLASLAVTTLSGVAYLGMSHARGPLAPLLGAEAAALQAAADQRGERKFRRPGRWLKEIHEAAANITLLLVIAHVGGVVLASVAHRENLPRAMITGRKAAEP
jgi:enoyl-CoA hydratase/carnithine racemase